MSEWITDKLPTKEDCASLKGTFYEDYVWTMVAESVETDYWYHIEEGIAWQPIVIVKPEPYVAPYVEPIPEPIPEYYALFILSDECGKPNKWVVYRDVGGIQADNLPTCEAAERIAAIYNEVMP